MRRFLLLFVFFTIVAASFTCWGGVPFIWDGGGTNALASNPANWVGDGVPSAGADIIIDATTNKNMTWDLNHEVGSWTQIGYVGTVTVATVYGTTGFTNFHILGDCVISNGVWTHTANSASETYRLSVTIGGNLIVGSNAVIDVTGKGYTYGNGPGCSNVFAYSGSYGGFAGGPCYGSIIAPTNLGSGGGWGVPSVVGGGAILMNVSGMIHHEGLICADGNISPGYGCSGSGGSIWLTAGMMSGGGTIRANGGRNSNAGGGRVALVMTNMMDFSGFTGTVSAYGGGTANGYGFPGVNRGNAGTIYREKQGDVSGKGELIVNNCGGDVGYAAHSTDLSGTEAATYDFNRITLTNGGVLSIGANDTLVVTNTVLMVGGSFTNGIWIDGGTLRTPSVFTYSNMLIGISAMGSTFSPAMSFTIGSNAEFRVDQPHVMACDVRVASGGNLTHSANATAEVYKINLTVNGALTVQAGGRVDVTGKGYAVGNGPGCSSSNWADSASYGGFASGPCYGSIVAPTNLGSGAFRNTSAAGGGVILLTVSGMISNEGLICADGGASSSYASSGSGGSIGLTAGTLSGGGIIRANGGLSGAGGGGRVALVVTNTGLDFTGIISAYGGGTASSYGFPGVNIGGAGTVYERTGSQGFNEGTMIVDNANLSATDRTEISSNVTEAVVGNVLIRNGGYLLLRTNQTLTVNGIWSNAANFVSQSGGQVIFAGGASSTSTVYGASTFMGLTCTNAGKTLLFQAGKTNTVTAYGMLTLRGYGSSNLVLRSTVDNTSWKLNVSSLAGQSVAYVDVKDSDAMTGVGTAVSALHSADSGGNANWIFLGGGQTNEWTGASNTAWAISANWSLGRAPIADDCVRIPSSKPRYPILGLAITVNGMELQTGASLDLGGHDLTVTSDAALAGVFRASGTETITFQANVDFKGGTFTPARSTVLLADGGDQFVNLANLTFFKVTVLNRAGTVVFGDGFTATELRCEAPGGTCNMTFQQGTTVMLRDLILLGAVGSTNLFLGSSDFGQKWNLAVSGYRSVQGVDVQDSDARLGLPIPAAFSLNSGNNQNWLFGVTPAVWLGTSNNNFHTAANWSSGIVPDATTRVRMDAANPMMITGAVTLLDLTVGGGVEAATGTVNAALTVVENITVLSNGTLVLNRPCVVSNGLYVLAGGMLTHSANSTNEINKLDVDVYGNVGVDVNAAVNVTGKGYALQYGPGYVAHDCWSPGSYGGRAFQADVRIAGATGPCYGSIVAPTNLGSGGWSAAGGGSIRMMVKGIILSEGLICADGSPSTAYATSGAGGSIWLTSGTLWGDGFIHANGGPAGGGGGGRVALVMTDAEADFSSFTGTISTYCGGAGAGAGTIYKQRAMDRLGYGSIWLDNNGLTNGDTDLPPSMNDAAGETERAVYFVTNAATFRLVGDFTVGDIWLQSANTRMDLGFKTLTVHAKQHAFGLGTVINYGAIIWMPDVAGTVFSIR